MKIKKDIYTKPASELTKDEKDFLLGAWSIKDLEDFANTCKSARNIYAKVERITPSGTRYISFYRVKSSSDGGYIDRLNRFLRCFKLANGDTKEDFLHSMNTHRRAILDKFFKDKKSDIDSPLKNGTQGMDAIFAELHPVFAKLRDLGFSGVSDDASGYRYL